MNTRTTGWTIAIALAATLAAPAQAQTITTSTLGARYVSTSQGTALQFRVRAPRATRLELSIFARPSGEDARLTRLLTRESNGEVWSTSVLQTELQAAGISTVYYGYRAWGPNWPFVAGFTPGSLAGFVVDCDGEGNRFNPNKLLLDPYALEMSHDPVSPPHNTDGTVFASGPDHRAKDSARVAPKGIALRASPHFGLKPERPLKDEIIYEVHVRGFTRNDPTLPIAERGTYKGAASRAAYLAQLGVTAIELLPVQETQNDQNDIAIGTDGDNYWGYMTLNYFAPDRRYAANKTPGGPTREFQDMVRAFHDQGIKVYIDVVYNHTGEGGLWGGDPKTANVLSFRGLDNQGYYELTQDRQFYWDNTGCGGNMNCASQTTRDLIIDSLRHWKDTLGVDGFRFDLAPVLGNAYEVHGFHFDKMDGRNALNRAVRELPLRPEQGGEGVDLIAEPWGIGDGTFQLGGFPAGWAEWNAAFRDTFRSDHNQLGFAQVTPGALATRVAGSSDLYGDDGRRPWHSINFLVAHDGFTLKDLYTYSQKRNGLAWPFGASDGGEDNNRSWDQGGDAAAQRQAARTGFALLMLSAGTPMLTGGDEFLRSQRGNNNAYNLDSEGNWLDWNGSTSEERFTDFASRLMRFRKAHVALRPAYFFRGTDADGDGIKDVAWLTDQCREADAGYMNDASKHFLAWRLDGSELGDSVHSIYVAYNGWQGRVTATLPAPAPGKRWYRVADTAAWMEPQGNAKEPGQEEPLDVATYDLHPRSVLLLIER